MRMMMVKMTTGTTTGRWRNTSKIMETEYAFIQITLSSCILLLGPDSL